MGAASRAGGRALVSLAATCALVALATLAGTLMRTAGLQDAAVVITYVLAVIGVALVAEGGLWCLVAAAASVVAYNFFFAAPTLSLAALDPAMPGTFAVMFVVALVAGYLASRLRSRAREAEEERRRTQALLELSRALQGRAGAASVVDALAGATAHLLRRALVWYPAAGEKDLGAARPYPLAPGESVVEERGVAARTLVNRAPCGAATGAFGSAVGLYVPVGGEVVHGVAGIVPAAGLAPEEVELWRSACALAALALDRISAIAEREEAAVRERDERTRSDLLRSISHDLRTPLTSISGNADVLLAAGESLDPERRRELLRTVRDDARWLRATVENLLTVTRLEEGGVRPQADCELVDDLVEEALAHVAADDGHAVTFERGEEALLVHADPTLVVQALVNLVNNAVAHTPRGTHVTVSARREGARVGVSVADDGPGIADAEKGRVFDAFHTSGGVLADGTRSVGLGLSVVRAVARAHGGSVTLSDAVPHGCVITLWLLAEEVPDVC